MEYLEQTDKIRQKLITPFELKLFEAALKNLDDNSNPLRFNNFAYAMRELTRHVLARLAPDEDVWQCEWYENEILDRPNGITRAQRVYFSVRGGLSEKYLEEELHMNISTIQEMRSKLIKAINKLSKYTHVDEKTFDLEKEQVNIFVIETCTSIIRLFHTIDQFRDYVLSALEEDINSSLTEKVLLETIEFIDELSSHSRPESIYTENVSIRKLGSTQIEFTTRGIVECELNYGSGSDECQISQAFPFTCNMSSSVKNLSEIEADMNSFFVNTSSWYGDKDE